MIKSPRECKAIQVNADDLKFKIFMCHKSKAELKGTQALKYIEWGEQAEIEIRQGKDKGKKIIGYQNLETVKNRKNWWNMGKRKKAALHFNYLVYDVGRTYIINSYSGDNFQDVFLKKEYGVSLNSIIFFLFQNVIGRANFGGGLMKIQTYELKNLSFLNIGQNDNNQLLDYESNSIFEELNIVPNSKIPISEQEPQPLPDRAALDKVVFDALGLTEEERKEVYRAVCQLVWNRISKAGSVKKRR